MKIKSVVFSLAVATTFCSCSLFSPTAQIRFQNLSSTTTLNGIQLGATYDASFSPGTTTSYSQAPAGDYTLMTRNGSGAWAAILDQYGNTIPYTLNAGRHYTFTIKDATTSPGVVLSLTFLID